MTFRSRDKGNRFESEAVKLLNDGIKTGKFKRIPGSGAIGTSMNEPILTGDISGSVDGLTKKLKIECKSGYGGEKQFTLKREWLTKIRDESVANYAFPVLLGKFSGARKSDGVQMFAVMDIDSFIYLMNYISDLNKELTLLYDEVKLGSNKKDV